MRRRGFTLIELLVVMGIIATLATMIIVFAPAFGDRQRASRGASMLQSWLNLAKQRAIRDRRPVGIRLPYQPASSYVTELQYVEVPDEGVGGTITVPYPANNPSYSVVQFTSNVGFQPTDPSAMLQAGDVIMFPDRPMANTLQRRIVQVFPPTQQGSLFTYQIQLDQALPTSTFSTTTHVVSRRARPVVGEPVLQMPKDIAIDVDRGPAISPNNSLPSWNRMFPPLGNTGGSSPFDILFSPAGQVIGNEGNLGSRICLWVRDVSLNTTGPNVGGDPLRTDPTVLPPGVNTLITVYTRTGHVTSHPIDPTGLLPNTNTNPNQWNPFRFTQDGLTSGNAGN